MSALSRFLDSLNGAARDIAYGAAKSWRRTTTFLRSREVALHGQSRDGRRYEWHRGSLRRFPPKVKGKAAVKAAKRARMRARIARLG